MMAIRQELQQPGNSLVLRVNPMLALLSALCARNAIQENGVPRQHLLIWCYTCIARLQMLAIRLPQSIEKRLEKLARRTGRTKSFYVREAILEHLDDLEDLYAAERSLERIRSGDEQTVPLEDALKRHGLED